MVVQHNLRAMNSNRMLGLTANVQAKSTEKLSSGYKINRAADDAAGLSISEKMRKQIRGLSQASLNAEDGISAVQTAEGALNEVQDMLQRMNELAVKAANGTMSEDDRSYIQNEIDQLVTEIDRVSETTKFNETYLLKGDSTADKAADYTYKQKQYVSDAVLYDSTGTEVAKGTVLDNTKTYYTEREAAAVTSELIDPDDKDNGLFEATEVKSGNDLYVADENGSVTFVKAGTTIAVGTTVYGNAVDAANGQNGYTIASADIDGTANKAAYSATGVAPTNYAALKDAAGNGVTGKLTVVTAKASMDVHTVDATTKTATTFKKGEALDIDTFLGGASAQYYKAVEYTGKTTSAVTVDDFGKYATDTQLMDKNGNEVAANGLYSYFDKEGNYKGGLYKKDENGDTVEATVADINAFVEKGKKEVGALTLSLHVGADATSNNQISIDIDAMSAKSLGVNGLKVDGKDDSNALNAVETIKASIQKVSEQRSALGAVQNRLEHTIANLDNVVENTTAAESQIRDTDMAFSCCCIFNNVV